MLGWIKDLFEKMFGKDSAIGGFFDRLFGGSSTTSVEQPLPVTQPREVAPPPRVVAPPPRVIPQPVSSLGLSQSETGNTKAILQDGTPINIDQAIAGNGTQTIFHANLGQAEIEGNKYIVFAKLERTSPTTVESHGVYLKKADGGSDKNFHALDASLPKHFAYPERVREFLKKAEEIVPSGSIIDETIPRLHRGIPNAIKDTFANKAEEAAFIALMEQDRANRAIKIFDGSSVAGGIKGQKYAFVRGDATRSIESLAKNTFVDDKPYELQLTGQGAQAATFNYNGKHYRILLTTSKENVPLGSGEMVGNSKTDTTLKMGKGVKFKNAAIQVQEGNEWKTVDPASDPLLEAIHKRTYDQVTGPNFGEDTFIIYKGEKGPFIRLSNKDWKQLISPWVADQNNPEAPLPMKRFEVAAVEETPVGGLKPTQPGKKPAVLGADITASP